MIVKYRHKHYDAVSKIAVGAIDTGDCGGLLCRKFHRFGDTTTPKNFTREAESSLPDVISIATRNRHVPAHGKNREINLSRTLPDILTGRKGYALLRAGAWRNPTLTTLVDVKLHNITGFGMGGIDPLINTIRQILMFNFGHIRGQRRARRKQNTIQHADNISTDIDCK